MILFWYGENQYAIAQQLTELKRKYVEKTGSDGDMQTLDMTSHELSELLDALAIVPMFVTSRLIVVRDLGVKKPDQKTLDYITKNTPDSTNLVLIESKPDKRSIYFKTFSKLKGSKEFINLVRPNLLNWILVEVKKNGANISTANASHLLDMCGNDQWRLRNELQKLTAVGNEITKQSIDSLVVPSVEHSAFSLVDALVKKDLPRTLKLYEQLVVQGEADQMILGAVMYQYRVFLAIKAGAEAQKAMGIAPFALQKSSVAAKQISTSDLKHAYNLLAQADINIKTGELGSVEALKNLFQKLCTV